MILKICKLAFGSKQHSGKAYILYDRVDARDTVLAHSAKAKQELRNGQCHMDLLPLVS